MKGKYNPVTWKTLAKWAPNENDAQYKKYLNQLINTARNYCNDLIQT